MTSHSERGRMGADEHARRFPSDVERSAYMRELGRRGGKAGKGRGRDTSAARRVFLRRFEHDPAPEETRRAYMRALAQRSAQLRRARSIAARMARAARRP